MPLKEILEGLVNEAKEKAGAGETGVKQAPIHIYPDGRVDSRNAARYTGYAEKTLAMKRAAGTGPPFIKRGKIFYYIVDLDAWLQAHGKLRTTAQARIKAKQAIANELEIAAAAR